MSMPKKKVKPHSVEQRLRDLERRVTELERIERYRKKVHREGLRRLQRVFSKSKS